MKHDKQEMTTEQKYVSVTSQPKPPMAQPELPARMVRQDRPEIQVEIQKARMIPVIPDQPLEDTKVSEDADRAGETWAPGVHQTS